MNCTQVAAFDEAITSNDAMIEQLQAEITALGAPGRYGTADSHGTPVTHTSVLVSRSPHARTSVAGRGPLGLVPSRGAPVGTVTGSTTVAWRGKAPPVSMFTGDDPECGFDDWLPSLERASSWNAWSQEECLMQLAGHLAGHALQEWNLLRPDERLSFAKATEALRLHLDFGGKAVAAQDFRHTTQHESESVLDFIRRLECTFRIAYGQDPMSSETRDTLLYGQLQEGLCLELMKGPAVSGARGYQELCIAARNEEKRLADLKRRHEYAKLLQPTTQLPTKPRQPHRTLPSDPSLGSRPRQPMSERRVMEGSNQTGPQTPQEGDQLERHSSQKSDLKLRCYFCKKPGHLMRDCPRRKKESESHGPSLPASTKQIVAGADKSLEDASSQRDISLHSELDRPDDQQLNPLTMLFSDSDEEGGIRQVKVTDSGSHTQLARVEVQGVPADGVVDTAADITIMGGKLFALVASAARLRKKNFMAPNKVPRTYDRKVFRLDGCMEMDISFAGKTLRTTVYIKMDAVDQLLLSEGVCRQLGIVAYHPSVLARNAVKNKSEDALVPSIRVSLVQSLRLPPSQSAVVPVKLETASWQASEALMVLE